VTRQAGYVALTFDDGPHRESTGPLLDVLGAAGALATFFTIGSHARRHPDLVEAVHDAGMWIGNHTWSHPRLTALNAAEARREIASAQAVTRRITGRTPALFRPPYGDTDAAVRAHIAGLGLTEVLWSVDTMDWNDASADDIVRAASAARPGDIILMHDGGYRSTVDALPRVIENLADRGLSPGKIDISGGVPTVVAP